MSVRSPSTHHVLAPGNVYQQTQAYAFVDGRLMESRYTPGTQLPLHAHEMPGFVLVVAGRFEEAFERHQRSCSRGSLMFRPRGERHRQQFHDHPAVCLTIELPAADTGLLRKADGRLPLRGRPALLAMRIYDEFRVANDSSALVIDELAAHLVAEAEGRPAIREQRMPPWLRRVVDVLDHRFHDPPTLSALSREASVHRVHLSRTMQRFLGCGIAEYVSRRRVHHACELLRTARGTLSEIAIECGFCDENHLRRTFVSVMGRSPRVYRESW